MTFTMVPPTITEQRATLAASLSPLGIDVLPVPYQDAAPPCIMIGNPIYEVAARVATVTWPIVLIVARTQPEVITSDFDSYVLPMLQILTKGVGMNFVVQSAAPRPSTPEYPIELPEYLITGTTTVPLC